MAYKRLNVIVDLIEKHENVIDVGTDHGLVPIFLSKRKHEGKIGASDLNKGPLDIAKTNLKEEGIIDKIDLYLSNGLESVDIDKYNVVVIAGMGGNVIRDIIFNSKYNKKYILQPANAHFVVRKELLNKGYTITNEKIVIERNKYYVVIVAEKLKKVSYTDLELEFGPILSKTNDEITNKYYKYLYNLYENNSSLSKDVNYKLKERTWLKSKIY